MKTLIKNMIIVAISSTMLLGSAVYAANYMNNDYVYANRGKNRGPNADCPYQDGSRAYYRQNRANGTNFNNSNYNNNAN